jgi:hypothetical protein
LIYSKQLVQLYPIVLTVTQATVLKAVLQSYFKESLFGKVWPKSYCWHLIIWSHLELELSMSLCSAICSLQFTFSLLPPIGTKLYYTKESVPLIFVKLIVYFFKQFIFIQNRFLYKIDKWLNLIGCFWKQAIYLFYSNIKPLFSYGDITKALITISEK